MHNTDIEEPKQGGQKRCVCNIDDWYVESDPDGIRKILCNRCGKDLLDSLIQQKVIEAQERSIAETYEDIRSTMLYHFAYSGRKTIRFSDIDKIAPPAICPISNEIYPNFRTQP